MTATPKQLHAVRGEVMKVTELSKAAEMDSDMQIFLLDRMRLKLQSAEKQLEEEKCFLCNKLRLYVPPILLGGSSRAVQMLYLYWEYLGKS
jgi:hypothetical protein